MFVDAPPTGAEGGRLVRFAPLPLNEVAVITPVAITPVAFRVTPEPTMTPVLAVIIPIESTFVTSSYVNVPAIPTVPLNLASLTKVIPVSHDLHEK